MRLREESNQKRGGNEEDWKGMRNMMIEDFAHS